MIKVEARDPNNQVAVEAAELMTRRLNRREVAERLNHKLNQQTMDEITRQLIYGHPPSEGLPDIRPPYPRYKSES